MEVRVRALHALALASALAAAAAFAAVPVGYRYVGSRSVSEGRVVYWYWNPEVVEVSADGASFIARMYARVVDVGQERPYVAEIRCDARTYREYGVGARYLTIDDGEPVHAVWRAGCRGGRAATPAERLARLGLPPPPVVAVTPARPRRRSHRQPPPPLRRHRPALRPPRRTRRRPIRAAPTRACALPRPAARRRATRRSPTPAPFLSR
ncbi:MAG: hypothetical protein IPM22_12420 [Betaproteobacteria bacterium]|nr:hypothetical protein [Betaproteobacteria bacterium]